MAGKIYFLEDKVYHKYGDNAASSSSVDNTTLKLLAPQGYYDGDDTVIITDEDFIAANIKDSATVFGKVGSISSHTTEQTATAISYDGTKLQLTAPEGFYKRILQHNIINELR